MIRTLIVEDEPIAARAHAAYVSRVAGFQVRQLALSGSQAQAALVAGGIDLVLLDLNLPDFGGLELLRRARANRSMVDVIVVSSARDIETVRAAVAQGAVQYLIKPFSFPALKEKLLAYKAFRSQVDREEPVEQADVDRALAVLRAPTGAVLPKGMTASTLEQVMRTLRESADSSASEVATALGISRITAGRYLGYLVDSGMVTKGHRYGQVGRPESRFRLAEPG